MRRSLLLAVLLGACSRPSSPGKETSTPTAPKPDPLASVTIGGLPLWTDRYAESNRGDMRFFNISALMKQHGLDRAQAVELQNHHRDLTRQNPALAPEKAYEEALARVRRHDYEDGRDRERLLKAPFIVAFDLDETLYDQYIDDTEVARRCHDVAYRDLQGREHWIKLAPRWKEALDRIQALGGAVVLYSANVDDLTHANLSHWTFEGRPLPEHPTIAGVLTNSHLVRQERTEGAGAAEPRKGKPVVDPSKDLRILDPELQRVILVDDNPKRVFQFRNLRLVHKFEADHYCETDDAGVRTAYEQILLTVVAEVEDAARHAESTGKDFAGSFLPYSALGRVAVSALVDGGMSEADAIAHVRAHPEMVPQDF